MIDLHTSIMEVPFKHFAVSDRHGFGQQQPPAVAGKGQHSTVCLLSICQPCKVHSHSPLSAALSATPSRTYYIIPSLIFHVYVSTYTIKGEISCGIARAHARAQWEVSCRSFHGPCRKQNAEAQPLCGLGDVNVSSLALNEKLDAHDLSALIKDLVFNKVENSASCENAGSDIAPRRCLRKGLPVSPHPHGRSANSVLLKL